MIKMTKNTNFGIVEYSMTSLSDVANLPNTFLRTGSTAIFCDENGNLRVWYFTSNDEDSKAGRWNEI